MKTKKRKYAKYATGGGTNYIEDNEKRKKLEMLEELLNGTGTTTTPDTGVGGGDMLSSLGGGAAGMFGKMLTDTVSGVSKGIAGEKLGASDALGMIPIVGGILGPIAEAFEAKDAKKEAEKQRIQNQMAMDKSYLQQFPTNGTNVSSYFKVGGYAKPLGNEQDLQPITGGGLIPSMTGQGEGVIVGNSHNKGGVKFATPTGQVIEAQGGETTDSGMIFSNVLKPTGSDKTFAELHAALLKDKQKLMKDFDEKSSNLKNKIIDPYARNTFEKSMMNVDLKVKQLFMQQQMMNDNNGSQMAQVTAVDGAKIEKGQSATGAYRNTVPVKKRKEQEEYYKDMEKMKEQPKYSGFNYAKGGNYLMEYPNGGTIPTRQEINDWNSLMKYYNDRLATDRVDRSQLDRKAGNYSEQVYNDYLTANPNFQYNKDAYIKKMQQYYNDVWTTPSTSAKITHPPSGRSDVDGWIGQYTSQYYIPTYSNTIAGKSSTDPYTGDYKGIFDPYTTNRVPINFDINNVKDAQGNLASLDYLGSHVIGYKKGGGYAMIKYPNGGGYPDLYSMLKNPMDYNSTQNTFLKNNYIPPSGIVIDPTDPQDPGYVTPELNIGSVDVTNDIKSSLDDNTLALIYGKPLTTKSSNPNLNVPENNPNVNKEGMIKGEKFKFATIAPYIDNMFNAVSTAMSPQVPVPNRMNAAPLPTDFDITAQLANVDRTTAATKRNLAKNTSSSAIARVNEMAANANAIQAKNELYNTKENMETQMETKDLLNKQGVSQYNLANLDRYNVDVAGRKKAMLSSYSANVANLVSDIGNQQAEKNMAELDKQKWQILSKQFRDSGVVPGNFNDVEFMKGVYKQYPDLLVEDIKNLKRLGRKTDDAVKLYNEINGTSKTDKDF